MRSVRRNVLFTFALFCFVFFIFLKTVDMGRVARLVPKTVVLFTLIMLIVQVITDIFHIIVKKAVTYNKIELKRKEVAPSKGGFRRDSTEEETVRLNRHTDALLWISIIPPLVFLFGIYFSVLIYTFCYLKLKGSMDWIPSAVIAGTLFALLYFIFDHMLHFFLYKGQLLIWFGP
ncbi:hypothetical protein ACFLRM_04680 [Acidobacteriota bacterium]